MAFAHDAERSVTTITSAPQARRHAAKWHDMPQQCSEALAEPERCWGNATRRAPGSDSSTVDQQDGQSRLKAAA